MVLRLQTLNGSQLSITISSQTQPILNDDQKYGHLFGHWNPMWRRFPCSQAEDTECEAL